jgi:hypothetical protein
MKETPLSSRARVVPLLTLVALLVAFPGAAPSAAKKKKVTCTEVGGDTIYRDRTLRLIQKVKHSKSDSDASTVTLKFCKPGSKDAPKTLATFKNDLDGSLTVDAVVRGGTKYLALELAEQTGTTDATDLFVYNLSTRKRTFAYGSEGGFDYVIASGGGVALLEAGKVTGYDGAGEHALGSAASLLAGSENAVYWTSAGTALTATLNGEALREL